jgi:hypothetical protein
VCRIEAQLMLQDSRLCVWNVDGSLQKYWKTHQGASVWSVDCSKEKNLIVSEKERSNRIYV